MAGSRLAAQAALCVCLAVMLGVLGMHLAMLPQGQWHDEYFTFSFLRALGWRGLLFRLAHWGPRPVSELMIFGYWRAVQAAGRPLIAPVLAACWAMLFGFVVAAVRPWRGPGRGARWALVLGVPALLLLAGPVGELWYWPLGALAYLPALGAACFATLVLAGPGVRGNAAWAWLAAALTVGALSVELGAFLALCLGPLLMAEAGSRRAWRQVALAAVPLAAALLVMASLLHGRAADDIEKMADVGTFHRAWPAVRAAVPHVWTGLWGMQEDGLGLVCRILVVTGGWVALRQAWPEPVSRRHLGLLLVALAGTALLSVAGAFYQFGALCCERHEAYRQALYGLMLVAGAGLLPRSRWAGWLAPAPVLLTGAVLVASPGRLANLVAEYRLAPAQEAAKAALFRSGADRASDTLEMVVAPAGPLLEGSPIPPGSYSMTPAPAWFVQGPMVYFGKTKMVVR